MGMTGFHIIKSAPLTFVGAMYLGGLVCSYCGSVVENNNIGKIFDGFSYRITRPMRGVKITLDGLILKPL